MLIIALFGCVSPEAHSASLDTPLRADIVASVGAGYEGDGTASVYHIGDGSASCTAWALIGAELGGGTILTMTVQWDGTSPATVALNEPMFDSGAPPMAWASGTDNWALIGGTADIAVDEVAGTAEIDFAGGQACAMEDYNVLDDSATDCAPLDATVSVTWQYGYYEATDADATATDTASGYCYDPGSSSGE